jgi:hypothetical protein
MFLQKFTAEPRQDSDVPNGANGQVETKREHSSPLPSFGSQLFRPAQVNHKSSVGVVIRCPPLGANPSMVIRDVEEPDTPTRDPGAVDVAVAFAWVQPLADTSHEQRLFGFLLDGARDTLAVLRSKHEGA